MAFVIKDRVAEQTVTTGTGTVTLLGAVRGYQAFSAIGNTNTTCYLILSGDGTGWEVGIGTYTLAGTTLSRTTILGSSNSGSAITLSGTSLVMCTNPANQISANGLLDQLFGSAQGTILYRDASAWAGLAPGTSGQFLKTLGAGANPAWAAAGAAGGSGGLWNQIMSATPTLANTGLSTWMNQGSAVETDTAVGMTITGVSGQNWQVLRKAVPGATPYTIKALVSLAVNPANFAGVGIGWTDGTKLHSCHIQVGSSLLVQKWTTATSFSANDFSGTATMLDGPTQWIGLKDDGTTVHFMFSFDGVQFIDLFSVAKASGFLGGSGYTNIFFGTCSNGVQSQGTLLSYVTA